MKKPSKPSSTQLAAIPLPPGLERDPIALELQKMGRRVTRAGWLTLDKGSDDETDLDPETKAFLDRHFPE